jgi:hypothetical protein
MHDVARRTLSGASANAIGVIRSASLPSSQRVRPAPVVRGKAAGAPNKSHASPTHPSRHIFDGLMLRSQEFQCCPGFKWCVTPQACIPLQVNCPDPVPA